MQRWSCLKGIPVPVPSVRWFVVIGFGASSGMDCQLFARSLKATPAPPAFCFDHKPLKPPEGRERLPVSFPCGLGAAPEPSPFRTAHEWRS
jgi:hypothetical protein